MYASLYGIGRVIWAVPYNNNGKMGALILTLVADATAVYLYTPNAATLGEYGPLVGDTVVFYAHPRVEDWGVAWECDEISVLRG